MSSNRESPKAAERATDTTRVRRSVLAHATKIAGALTAEIGERVHVADVLSVAAERALHTITAADVRRGTR